MKIKEILALVLAICAIVFFAAPSLMVWAEETDEDENETIPAITAEGRCLAFASDLHGLDDVLENALAGFPGNTEYLSLIGDLVGDRGGDAPEYNAGDIYERAHAIMDWISMDQFSIIWADHDKNAVNQHDMVKCEGGYVSEQIYEGKNEDGSAAYYIYGVGFYHMTKGGSISQEAAEAFKSWVKDKDENVPVIVLCHVPLQALRGDNLGAVYWNEALNYAATGVEGITTEDDTAEITRNVLYLYGHNHTADKTEYLFQAGTRMSVQIDTGSSSGTLSDTAYSEAGQEITVAETEDEEYTQLLGAGRKAKAQGVVSNIYYTAMIPGYLKTSGNASLVSITDSMIRITKYRNGEEVSLGTDGATGEVLGPSIELERILWEEPEYTWSDDLSTVTATRVCRNTPSLIQTEQAAATSEVTKEASCEADGERTYTAVFENPVFQTQTLVQTIPAYGHDWQEWSVEKEATATEDGKMTRVCSRDASHVEEKVIPATGTEQTETAVYSFILGENGSWIKGSSTGYNFIVKRSGEEDTAFGHFSEILVDGKQLNETDYALKEGSLNVTLIRKYLETLSEGSHILKVVFDDGTAETMLKIATVAPEESNMERLNTPNTGDGFSPGIWVMLTLISGTLLVVFVLIAKRIHRAS